MKSVLKKATYLLVGVCALVAAPLASSAQELKIGFVNLERIFREATPAKAANAKLEQEFSGRVKDLRDLESRLKAAAEKLDKDAPVLSDAERSKRQRELGEMDKDLQRRQREYREDLNQRLAEERNTVIEKANRVIRQMAESEKYDYIFQEAVYFSPRIDITDKVLKALNAK